MKLPLLALATVVVLVSGCGGRTAYVDPNSSRLVTTTDSVNLQDFSQAADAMTAARLVTEARERLQAAAQGNTANNADKAGQHA